MNIKTSKFSRLFQGLLIASVLSGCAEQSTMPERGDKAASMSPEVRAMSQEAERAALAANPELPEDLSGISQEHRMAVYDQTQKACGQIHSVCVSNGEEAQKCVNIEAACLEGSEAILRGEQTRGGLLKVLTELVTDILGVGPVAVDLLRCVSSFLSCALLNVELTCAVDLVECVVEDVIL